MNFFLTFILLAILLISVIWHELAHGYAAYALGDPTAKLRGRLTLNPLVHLDPIGSFLIPLIMAILSSGVIFGWARPVPFNPYLLKGGRWGTAFVAAAGPLANLILVFVFSALLHFNFFNLAIIEILIYTIFINLVLAIFNLIPLPPLDGSKIVNSLIPLKYQGVSQWFSKNWLILYFFILFFIFNYFLVLVRTILFFLVPNQLHSLLMPFFS